MCCKVSIYQTTESVSISIPLMTFLQVILQREVSVEGKHPIRTELQGRAEANKQVSEILTEATKSNKIK